MEQDLRDDLEIQRVRGVVWVDGRVSVGFGGCDVYGIARERVLEDGKHREVVVGIGYGKVRKECCNVTRGSKLLSTQGFRSKR